MVVGRPFTSFKAMLFFLKDTPYHPVEIPDPNMACVFAHTVRSGQSLISKRYSKADDNTKIVYLDANNLYDFGMSRKLQWMTSGGKSRSSFNKP